MDNRVEVVPRLQWGAVPPRCRDMLKGPAQRVVIHHTALAYCRGPKESIDQLTHIQMMHMKERGFDDIGYNFLIGGDGTVYEARGWGVIGAHTKGNNQDSLGIALMGNDDTPSAEALSSVRCLLQDGVTQGYLHHGVTLFGHRDLGNTECPGDRLYAALPQLKTH